MNVEPNEGRYQFPKRPLPAAALTLCLVSASALGDLAPLVDEGVLVLTNPSQQGQGEEETSPLQASYISSGGWAVTSDQFADAATMVFDFDQTASVSQATLSLPIREEFPQNLSTPLQVFVYSDNGAIEVADLGKGLATPVAELDANGLSVLTVDVTGPVNAALHSGRFVGFRVNSAVPAGSVAEALFPAFTGVRFFTDFSLEFTPGVAPALASDRARFDGHRLTAPGIEVAGIGEVDAEFILVDVNNSLFELVSAVVTGSGGSAPPLSGIELFDCAAFGPPANVGVAAGTPTFSVSSGVLDMPSVALGEEQLTFRLEFIEGSAPAIFETLSIGAVQSGANAALISALGGGLIVEPSQDFVSLCHGWVLIGDFLRNRVVERNLISGETGKIYPFNTSPDQFTLDEAAGQVFMTVHPESERLYRLDLNTGQIVHNSVQQTITRPEGSHTYHWALRDITLGENGNVFALMLDGPRINPEIPDFPFADSGLWLGLMDPNANFLFESIPLLDPVRVEYDPVLDHVFLATASNLATFTFNPATNGLVFVPGTDIPVGNSCTDFQTSPDGTRLAYTCPTGNRPGTGEEDFSIVDMNPVSYFDSDGEWFLGSSPVSATFNADGTLLVATDNERLYFFDVVTHLILEDFELGLLEGEAIRKIRLSRDGDLLYLFLDNGLHAASSKFYWMNMPAITGTPL